MNPATHESRWRISSVSSEGIFTDRKSSASPCLPKNLRIRAKEKLRTSRIWATSRGSALQDRRVLTSAAGFPRVTYGLITAL